MKYDTNLPLFDITITNSKHKIIVKTSQEDQRQILITHKNIKPINPKLRAYPPSTTDGAFKNVVLTEIAYSDNKGILAEGMNKDLQPIVDFLQEAIDEVIISEEENPTGSIHRFDVFIENYDISISGLNDTLIFHRYINPYKQPYTVSIIMEGNELKVKTNREEEIERDGRNACTKSYTKIPDLTKTVAKKLIVLRSYIMELMENDILFKDRAVFPTINNDKKTMTPTQ